MPKNCQKFLSTDLDKVNIKFSTLLFVQWAHTSKTNACYYHLKLRTYKLQFKKKILIKMIGGLCIYSSKRTNIDFPLKTVTLIKNTSY